MRAPSSEEEAGSCCGGEGRCWCRVRVEVVAVTVGERQGGKGHKEIPGFLRPDFARNPSALSVHTPHQSASNAMSSLSLSPHSSFLLPLRSVPWPVLKAIEPTLPLLLDSLLATAYVVQIHKLKRRALQIGAKAPVFSSLAV
jgi:hypothetical protein